MSVVKTLAAIQPLNRTVKRVVGRLPYRLRRAITNAVKMGVGSVPPSFNGVYQSFAEVPGIRQQDSAQRRYFVQSGLSQKVDSFTGSPVLRVNHQLLPLVAAMIGRPVRILDFGGSGGIDYKNVTAAGIEVERYLIVETPDTATAGRSLWPSDKHIAFTSELPEPGERYDIVYAWGALHCADNPIETMRRFADYKPAAVLITHSFFADKSFVRRHGRDSSKQRVPQWVLSLKETSQAMNAAGYRLAMSCADGDSYNVDNYPPEYRIGDTHTLFYVPS